MKKISKIGGLIFLSVILTGVMGASSLTEYYCEYKNEHVTLAVKNRFSSWMFRSEGRRRSGSAQTVEFKMKANPGFKMVNSAEVKFDNTIHNISQREGEHHFPYTHTVSFRGSFFKSSIFELKYTVMREGSTDNITVTKKFKIIIPRQARGSHDRVEIRLEEMAQ